MIQTIEILVYGILFLITCTVGYLTFNELHKTHQEKQRHG